jgi:CxxC motif-containing protein
MREENKMPELIDIICTNCPMGCSVILTIDKKKDEVTNITGNQCKQGEKFALDEFRNPVRVLTATVLTNSNKHPLLSVRTNKPISKDKMKEFMYSLAEIRVKSPVKIGQIIRPNIMNMGVDLIATSELYD